eukprot:CAMPEP_0179902222 /NCGR_PEP_ID=MMETSP0982-20121206/40392_1 /TAXON_ID=483367 /ORGANISM="non described non described, Strain CCMP 2436" /LENGTH=65 /DNA_ID=CAMNT_0021801241 /DNA_START=413 /DNA_END=611 /DNA_ORIENTATION=-
MSEDSAGFALRPQILNLNVPGHEQFRLPVGGFREYTSNSSSVSAVIFSSVSGSADGARLPTDQGA